MAALCSTQLTKHYLSKSFINWNELICTSQSQSHYSTNVMQSERRKNNTEFLKLKGLIGKNNGEWKVLRTEFNGIELN